MSRSSKQRFLAVTAITLALVAAGSAGAQGYGEGHVPEIGTGFIEVPNGPLDCNDPGNPLANCGFESGSFPPWVAVDAAMPVIPMAVSPGGTYFGYGFFTTAPTEGTSSATHGWDDFGTTPATLELGQDVSIAAGATATLTFDYRGAWDLATFGATLDRTFEVHIEPSGGGAAMQTDVVLTATAGTMMTDTGILNGSVDVSAFLGQSVRANFVWTVPESAVGPAFFELDNVLIQVGTNPADVTGEKSVSGSFQPGSSVSYVIVLTNNGPGDQGDNPGDEFLDMVPAEIINVTAMASSGTAGVVGNTVSWNGAIAAGATVTITIDGDIDPTTATGTVVSNQGVINYDAVGDGVNDATNMTQAPPAGGPTDFEVAADVLEIPTLDSVGLLLLVLAIVGLSLRALVRRRTV